MSYRIQYGVSRVDKLSENKTFRFIWVTSVLLLVVIVVAALIWPQQMEAFRKELLPMFTETGAKAILTFFDNIESGAGLSDAVQVFFHEIIHAVRN